MKRIIYLMGLCSLVAFLVFSCGKVTQVINEEKPLKSFQLNTALSLTSGDLMPIAVTGSLQVSNSMPDLYVAVQGIMTDGKTDLLSWGQADFKWVTENVISNSIVGQAAVPTQTKSVLEVTTYRRDGIELTGASQYMWSKFIPNVQNESFRIESKDVKQGYSCYQVWVYLDGARYLMRLFDGEGVTQNLTVNTPPLSAYLTFIDTLFWRQLSDKGYQFKKTSSRTELIDLYSQEWFEVAVIGLTLSNADRFNLKDPVFGFWDKRIDVLLELHGYYLDKKWKMYRNYLDTMSFLNKDAKEILVQTIKNL